MFSDNVIHMVVNFLPRVGYSLLPARMQRLVNMSNSPLYFLTPRVLAMDPFLSHMAVTKHLYSRAFSA